VFIGDPCDNLKTFKNIVTRRAGVAHVYTEIHMGPETDFDINASILHNCR
jgi:hypothetical protein